MLGVTFRAVRDSWRTGAVSPSTSSLAFTEPSLIFGSASDHLSIVEFFGLWGVIRDDGMFHCIMAISVAIDRQSSTCFL